MEETDLIVLWGSNARETHPIFFHHVLKAIRRGAKVYVVDPRRTATAEWADGWLPVHVGADIALANAVAATILEEGLANREFIRRATSGFEEWEAYTRSHTPEKVASITGVEPSLVRRLARDYARADRAMICWTLGITEHHNAVDNVLGLINLALVTGHVGRWGSGLNPLRGQNNVQGGGDMGALPNKLPGFEDVESAAARAKWEALWGRPIPPKQGLHLTGMFEAMAHGQLRALYVLGENPAQSEADKTRTIKLLSGLDHLVVQDIVLTKTAELAHVVLPASVSFCESEGTVTSSERRVQRVRKALAPPGQARDDIDITCELSKRLGYDMGMPAPKQAWDELRRASPLHGGMSYERLEALGGIQWPCPDETSEGQRFLHARLWKEPVEGRRAPFHVVHDEPPVEALDGDYPLRLTTGRRLDSFNTGVLSRGYESPRRLGETVDLSPHDAGALGVQEGEKVRVVSRRGAVVAPVRVDPGLRRGLVFMTFHFPDEVDTNQLTIDAADPRSGTAEFKAAAVRVERLEAPHR
ncbi:MAG: formate dehydrogenase subunit alpha [Myxococcaceae bacterium]